MLKQIEWRLQNRPIIKSGVLPVTALLFSKKCLVLAPLKRVNLMCQRPKWPYLYFSEGWEFNFRVLFLCEYP